ncbi:hypothetical protein [Aestuariivirga sp.]|uniref:hypothetical protein n=1 Tax=Aestuariivirga sp. TaxID=2650926 RepID=UPI0039E5A20C
MMNHAHTKVVEALVFVHGCRAEDEAARQALVCESAGEAEFAKTWRKVQESLKARRLKKAA